MVEDVQQAGGQRQRGDRRHDESLESKRKPEADVNDADVLDRVVGEQTLEVVLHQRVEDAHHRGGAAERQHHAAPPPGGRPQQIEGNADETVDRDLGHHAAHQRRHVARRGGMGERQPDVERIQAGLGARARQRQREDDAGQRRRRDVSAHRRERIAARRTGQQREGEQQRQRAEARHDNVDEPGPRVAGVAVARHDQRPRGERHELPGDEKRVGVVGEQHQVHAGEERRIERQHPLRLTVVAAVTDPIEARRRGAEIDDDDEERRKSVEAKVGPDPRQPDGQRQGRRRLAREKKVPAAARQHRD